MILIQSLFDRVFIYKAEIKERKLSNQNVILLFFVAYAKYICRCNNN